MSVLATFEASSSKLALGPTLEALPSLDVELERQYALDPDQPIAFCWIGSRDPERLERILSQDETIATFERIERTDETALYRLCRSETGVVQAYRRWVAAGGELLECRSSDGRWAVKMRFPDRESFSQYHAFLEGEGVEFHLHRLADGTQSRNGRTKSSLTDPQREALSLAYEHGFFNVPRETGLAEIAERLDISTQAVSERLRRGQAQLARERLLSD